MLAKLRTFSLLGIEALPVEVEVDVSPGALPKTVIVGLPDQAIKESTHRIERAMVNSGFTKPQDRIVINLAPAVCPLVTTLLPPKKALFRPKRGNSCYTRRHDGSPTLSSPLRSTAIRSFAEHWFRP